jgi:VanZ family protein
MAAIFYVSSLSQPPLPPGFGDKPSHSLAYTGLAVTIVRALVRGLPARVGAGAGLGAVLLTIAYGVTDEFHQSFVPGRSMDVYDLFADAIGAMIGTAACWAWGIISHSPDPSARSGSSRAKSSDERPRGASRHGL